MILSVHQCMLLERKRTKRVRPQQTPMTPDTLNCKTYLLKKRSANLALMFYLIFVKGESEPSWKLCRLVLPRSC